MRALVITFALLGGSASAMDRTAFTEADAFKFVAAGMCGSLPVGTGLVGGKGWLHQPTQGSVDVRLSGAGLIKRIGYPASPAVTLQMVPGLMDYIEVIAPSGSRLEWKVPGHVWGPVPTGFQLPPTR